MKLSSIINFSIRPLVAAALLFAAAHSSLKAVPQAAPNISVDTNVTPNKGQRGRTVRASVTMDIPSGYHINSNRPAEKFLIPTELKVDAPDGFRVSSVSYPRAISRKLKFSKNRVLVYEGRATMRFNVTIPSNARGGSNDLKLRLRFQSCSDELCFPPVTRELKLTVKVG